MLGPILTGERVRLAPPTPALLETYCGWFADSDVTRYLDLIYPPSLSMETEWFEKTARSETDIVWAVFVDDTPIGTTALHGVNWRNRNATTGNLIGEKSFWGQGYASEAVALRTRFAFETLGLEKLKTVVYAENVASRRVLEKNGYETCGLRRRELWRFGRWHDLWLGEALRNP
jgi:[ribosomal protein S5]-alanine N-acetyltransferase